MLPVIVTEEDVAMLGWLEHGKAALSILCPELALLSFLGKKLPLSLSS